MVSAWHVGSKDLRFKRQFGLRFSHAVFDANTQKVEKTLAPRVCICVCAGCVCVLHVRACVCVRSVCCSKVFGLFKCFGWVDPPRSSAV